jgi:hypothetical protein
MRRRIQVGRGPDVDALAEQALGFDIQAELDLCKRLAVTGGRARVKEVFDGRRAARLFQALLLTGRHEHMDDHWRASIEAGIERGTLAPPEWN